MLNTGDMKMHNEINIYGDYEALRVDLNNVSTHGVALLNFHSVLANV